MTANVGGFGQVWDFPIVRPEPKLIILQMKITNQARTEAK
jgi:hypothetical protein